MKFHISRWRYWQEYLAVFLLILLAIWFTDNALDTASLISGTIAFVLFAAMELIIRLERVNITDTAVEFRKGILSKNVARIMYTSVSNVATHHTLLQRILRFGDVKIDTPGGPGFEIVLRGFEDAAKIDRIIKSNIHRVHEAHAHPAKTKLL